jgi:hypothetical protein
VTLRRAQDREDAPGGIDADWISLKRARSTRFSYTPDTPDTPEVDHCRPEAEKPRRPWWFYVLFGIGALVTGASVLMIALVMFFMLIYGW